MSKSLRITELRDVEDGFALLTFYNFHGNDETRREHGACLNDLTWCLAHHAESGWRPVSVWTSCQDTWLNVLVTQ